MPPRKRQPPPPSHNSDPNRATRRSQQAQRPQTRVPAVDLGEDDSFDLDNISGGSDDNNNNNSDTPANNINPTDNSLNPTSQRADSGINDPHLAPREASTAADVHYFFKKRDDGMKVCV